ncbi:MAG: adenylate/guanylate cyclase domain-containing protein [Proteobacteria bacterium]|nr:adenylate/guanylate cyclase domain-containing protein [Pseudomonadota bacterium]
MLKAILLKGRFPVLFAGFLFTFLMCAIYVYRPQYFKHLNDKLYDVILKGTFSTKVTGRVVIVDLDEQSIERFGQWPWARYRIAILLEKIRSGGALAVGLDILFSEPDRTSPQILKENLKKDLNVAVVFQGLPDALLDNDRIFADILSKGPYVLGFFFDDSRKLTPGIEKGMYAINPAIIKMPEALGPERWLYDNQGGVFPVSGLADVASSIGFINSRPEDDGILRSAPLLMTMKGKVYPCLALATLQTALGKPQMAMKMTKGGVASLKIGKTVVPLDKNGRMLLNFRGMSRTFSYFSAVDVMEGKNAPDAFRNKIVFIGTSAAGLKDLRATPLDPLLPGVEAQAVIVDNILKGDWFFRPDWTPGLELSLIVLFGVITSIIISWSSAIWTILFVITAGMGMWHMGLWSLEKWRIYMSPLYPFLMLAGNFTVLNFIKFWKSEREKRFVRDTFGRYLSDSIVKEILDTPEGLNLGGEKKRVTIMMTDLRGFTAICERLDPEDVLTMINHYLSEMIPIIGKYQGTIDEFIGDAILAIFGAPITRKDDAARAVACAVEMQRAMEQVNRNNHSKGLPHVEQGIGLHTGETIIGNIGSELRSKYGVVGKNVNFTARVESYTVGGQIYISEHTMKEVGPILKIAGQREVKPKGVKEPTTIYEVGGIFGDYNTMLPEKIPDVFIALQDTIDIDLIVLEGKHAGDEIFKGKIVKLAGPKAEVTSDLAVNPLDNLKLTVFSREGKKITSDLYGKVVDVPDNTRFILNFTSVPPEAETLFGTIIAGP